MESGTRLPESSLQGQETEPGSLSVLERNEISSLAEEWDALCDRVGVSPFRRPGWFEPWWQAFGSGKLELLIARRDERLVGVLPLMQSKGSLMSLSNWHTPEFGMIAEDTDAEQQLLDSAFDLSQRRLDLGFLLEEEPQVQRITRHAERRAKVITRTVESSPYVEISGDWEEYHSRLTSKRRSDLRRRRRRLEDEGEYAFESHDGSERLAELLAEGLRIEAVGMGRQGGTAIAENEETRIFYEQVARWAAGNGQLRLCFLRLDGKAIAFAFCIADAHSHYVLKIGFVPAYSRFGPGQLLTREMLQQAFEAGLETYEFLGNADDYKMIWTDRVHDLGRLQAFPSTAIGFTEYVAWKHGRPLVQRALRR